MLLTLLGASSFSLSFLSLGGLNSGSGAPPIAIASFARSA